MNKEVTSGYLRVLKSRPMPKSFKGIWMPIEITANKKLKLHEKVILSFVRGLTGAGKDCFVSNAFFADLCGCSRATISRAISHLKSLNLLHTRELRTGRGEQTQRLLFT